MFIPHVGLKFQPHSHHALGQILAPATICSSKGTTVLLHLPDQARRNGTTMRNDNWLVWELDGGSMLIYLRA
jgi:hypothetical protein